MSKDIDIEMNKYIKAVKHYELTKELPPRLDELFDKDKIWQCSYCDFINISCEGLLKEDKWLIILHFTRLLELYAQ